MQPTTKLILVTLLGLGSLSSANTGGGFLKASKAADLTVQTDDVESSLRESFKELLMGGEGPAARRLARIERSLWQTFQALPKNSVGRLAPRGVRYIVHSYFAKEHGWLIKGLEPHGMQLNMSEVHEASILQDRAPALVQALLEARQSEQGLAFGDIVVMVATLEQLIFDESVKLLQAAYTLNDMSVESAVDGDELHEILRSYLLVFQMGMRMNLSDVHRHQVVKRRLRQRASNNWITLVEFEQDATANFGFAQRAETNPFVAPLYTFEAASHVVETLAQDYGKWQNAECRQMKEELINLDTDGTGRVLLSDFYSQPETADYQFSESVDYLREIGALDETVSSGPRVRIANYMTGPSNCIASSSYYSVCCLSDCEALMNELEEKIEAPSAPAVRLLSVAANLTATTYAEEAPRQLSQDLQDKMLAIAERHSGEVPIHGRLFAQWLHFAFPLECPYPHVHETAAALTPDHWQNGKSVTASKEERARLISEAKDNTTEVDEEADSANLEPGLAANLVAELSPAWSDDEVLPLLEPASPAPGGGALGGRWVRVAAQLVVLLAVLRLALEGLRVAGNAFEGDSEKKKQPESGSFYV